MDREKAIKKAVKKAIKKVVKKAIVQKDRLICNCPFVLIFVLY